MNDRYHILIEKILSHWEDYYLEREAHALIEDCLEFSGCLEVVNPEAENATYRYGRNLGGLAGEGEYPLAYWERGDMRDFLLERQMGLLEGQSTAELEEIWARLSRPQEIRRLLSDLAFFNAMRDQAAAKKTRVALRRLGHYVSRQD